MNSGRALAISALALTAALAGSVEAAHLRGRIVRVGFSGSSSDQVGAGADRYRVGRWTPILVELTNDDGDLFNGSLEVRQPDRDGDEIMVSKSVSVRDQRRYYLYVPAGVGGSRGRFNVRVLDEEGALAEIHNDRNERITELEPPRSVIEIAPDSQVILDISEKTLNQITPLLNDPDLLRPLVRLRGSPGDLPDNAAGLEMADVIVWDGADPSRLRDPAQLRALTDWTQRGGVLVLGVSRTWQVVNKSRLGEFLPAQLSSTATLSHTSQLADDLVEMLFGDASAQASFDPPISWCPVTVDRLASNAELMIPDTRARRSVSGQYLITRRPCGRGEVVLVGVEMRELFEQTTLQAPLLRQVLGIRRWLGDPEDAQYYAQHDLFGDVERMTAFQMTAGFYFLFAFVFAVGYILVATAGCWSWLKKRGIAHHAWSIFAALAVLASATSLLAVQAIRGIHFRVEEFSVVDGQAGSDEAVATCHFGLKTPIHTRLDLSVPSDWRDPKSSPGLPGGLRLLPPHPDEFRMQGFAASQQYEAVPSVGELHDVPFRATLKQLEAIWRGEMDGRLNASLRRQESGSPYLHPSSWIQNDLGKDLEECYLIVIHRPFLEHRPNRYNEGYVYPILKLPAGKRISVREVLQKHSSSANAAAAGASTRELAQQTRGLLLEQQQREWLSAFMRDVRQRPYQDEERRKQERIDPSRFAKTMLLLSTFEEINPRTLAEGHESVRRSRGQDLDRSIHLTRGTALFVGFAGQPGPARLCYRKAGGDADDWDPLEPDRATVMYRIMIPVSE